jgi:hypothetical protein
VNGEVSTLVTDPERIDYARLSPDQRTLVYVRPVRHEGQEVITTLVFIDRESGSQLQTLDVRQDEFMNAVTDLDWIDGGLLWIKGHHNPHCGTYSEVDVRTGRVLRTLEVARWARSSRGVIANTPCVRDPEYDSLEIAGRQIYPPKKDRRKHSFAGSQTWSPDGKQIALADYQPATNTLHLVILDSSGRIVRRQRISAKGSIGEVPFLVWRDEGTILLPLAEATLRIGRDGHVRRLPQTLDRPRDRSIEVKGRSHNLQGTTCPVENDPR